MSSCRVLAICNQKGGVGKTGLAVNLCAGLAQKGYKTLAVDLDPQSDLTISLGFKRNDELPNTVATSMARAINGRWACPHDGKLCCADGFYLLPANIELAGVELMLADADNRETVLKRCLDEILSNYDFIVIDCSPSLSLLTINSLAAADSVLIPVQSQYLSLRAMTQLVNTIRQVQSGINPSLTIEGAVLTMTEPTTFSKETAETLREQYGSALRVFDTQIPRATKAAEASAAGMSIFGYSPKSKVARAYEDFVTEVLSNGSQV